MKKSFSSNMVNQTLRLYGSFNWVRFFAMIRFWTGSYITLEKLVPKKGKILDLGCGYGIFANYLALTSKKREIIGVDYDKLKVKNANRGLTNTTFLVGDATEIGLNKLSVILLHDVLHHLDSYEKQEELIEKCQTMLQKNGQLFIVEIDKNPFWKWFLGRITDFIMYKGSPVYYRYKKEMLILLRRHFTSEIYVETLPRTPFIQTLYICQKR